MGDEIWTGHTEGRITEYHETHRQRKESVTFHTHLA